MDLETFLVLLFVLVDDWISNVRPCEAGSPGRSPLLSDGEVLTLAILSQWPRFRRERCFCASPTSTCESTSRPS